MSPLVDDIIVGLVVAIAAIWAVRFVWRSTRKNSGCPSCSDSGSCPMMDKNGNVMDLKDLPTSPDKPQ